jgi:hypothetical protein
MPLKRLLVCLGFSTVFFVQSAPLPPPAIQQWIEFETAVRDGLVPKEAARARLPEIMRLIHNYSQDFQFSREPNWTFPLKNYGLSSIGGKNGDGFQPHIIYGSSLIKGYDFLDGNRHGGHPAHDIFITDKNQDLLDDRMDTPVQVVSMVDAIVLGTNSTWKPGNPLRGGNVVWTYHPPSRLVIYYAHLKEVKVKPGEHIQAGKSLGTVGRTGITAWGRRSPTHLHVMVLGFDGKNLIPLDFYPELTREK